jgi:protein gp37
MNKTPIEWCRTYAADGSFERGYSVNPVRFRPRGSTRTVTMCQRVSPGCQHCYAETITRRFWPKDADEGFHGYNAIGLLTGEFVLDEEKLLAVLRHKKPTKIFWGDMTDLFGEWVPDAFLDRIFAVCALTPHITHMFLTKRADRMRAYMVTDRDDQTCKQKIAGEVMWLSTVLMTRAGSHEAGIKMDHFARCFPKGGGLFPNVWLGVSVENQEQADKRIPDLLNTPAAVKFISAEPLLRAVNIKCLLSCYRWIMRDAPAPFTPLADDYEKAIDWVIVGGESGAGARPMHPDWARSLRDQCVAAGVPFFFKQWGEFSPLISTGNPNDFDPSSGAMARIGKKRAGAMLDGREWRQFPEVR